MRKLLIVGAAAAALTVPAFAQPRAPEPPVYEHEEEDYEEQGRYEEERNEDDYGRPAPVLPQPGEVREMAGAMDRLLGAVMDLPIGGIARAIDPYGRSNVPPGATVRDMATRDDPYAEQRIRAGLDGATRGVGAMSEALTRALPVLQRSFEQVSRDMEAAMEQAEIGRPD